MLSANKYALQTISHQGFQSSMFFILVFVASVCLFGTGLFTENMQSGVDQSGGQIGADIIVVPSDYSNDAKGTLFAGKACTILLSENLADQIAQTAGVNRASAQLYLETLSLDCCSAGSTQVIAYDPATDFTVGKWLKEKNIDALGEDEILAGFSSGLKTNDRIMIYGHSFTVAAVLSETGMGYDESLFVPYVSANKITTSSDYKYIFGEESDLASMILVDIADDRDTETLRRVINAGVADSGASAYATDELIRELSRQLQYFKSFGFIVDTFVIILAAAALFALVTITFHQRRNRVGSLLSVGIGRKKIIRVFLTEYFYLTLAGTAAGILLVCIFVFPLHTVIKNALDMPYKFIGIQKTALLALKTALINFGIMLLASSLSFFRILKYEPANLAEEQA